MTVSNRPPYLALARALQCCNGSISCGKDVGLERVAVDAATVHVLLGLLVEVGDLEVGAAGEPM